MGRPREVSDEQILSAARSAFVAGGPQVSVATVAAKLGISHAAILQRFGTKERLMIAALGPPETVPWTARLDAGPDERPIPEQLVELGREMSAYFEELGAKLSILHAAGIGPARIRRGRKEPPPAQAFRALTAWFTRAQASGRLGACDVGVLA